jgi:hypothetical protein
MRTHCIVRQLRLRMGMSSAVGQQVTALAQGPCGSNARAALCVWRRPNLY